MSEIPEDQTVYAMVDGQSLHSYDLSHAFINMDSLPIRHFALARWQERQGLDPDNATLYHMESNMGKELAVIREEVLDDFLAFTINSFEFCYISRASLSRISEKERHYFLTQDVARSHIYSEIKFDPELAGRYVHFQRQRNNVFLIVPNR